MTRLLLARHGTTFEDGEVSVMIGTRTDKPLSAKGRAQVRALIASLASEGFRPDAIQSGRLKRQRQTADMLAEAFSVPIEEVAALDELDYGRWEGLGREILARDWPKESAAWKNQDVWPEGIFGTLKHEKADALRAWLDTFAQRDRVRSVLAVSSMGALRTLYGVVEPERMKRLSARGRVAAEAGVLHAHVCEVRIDGSRARIVSWNKTPSRVRRWQAWWRGVFR